MSIKKPFIRFNKVDYHHPHLLLNVDAVAMQDGKPAAHRRLMIEFQKQVIEEETDEEGFVSDLDIVFNCVRQDVRDKLEVWIEGAEETVSEYDVITKPLTEQIRRTAANLREQKKENLEYQKLLKERDREFNKLEQINSQLVKKSKDLKAKIAKLEEKLTIARNRNQETIEMNKRDMEEKESKFDEQIKAIKNECVAHIDRTKDECNSRVNHTKREYDARIINDKREYDARIETYQARLASLSTALAESKEVASSMNARIAVLEEQLIEETNSKISFKRRSESLHIELADCQLQSAALETTIAKQEGDLKILWDKLSRLLEHNPDQRNILDNAVHFFNYSRSPIIRSGTDMVIPRELYVINSMIEIEEGAILTIEAGTVMEFGENAGIVCNGNLIVNGTKDKPVVFRSNSETGSDRKWQNISIIGANSSCTIKHCVVESGGGCKSAIHKGKKIGGGILFMDAGQSDLENVDIKNCEASFGAGIYAKNTKLKLANTVFEENHAINESESDFALGGGMMLIDASIEANTLSFANNTSDGYGGAIYVEGQSIAFFDLRDSSFTSNQAEIFGGTLFASGKSIIKVHNVSNISNVAGVHGGAFCIAGEAYLEVTQSFFYGNICGNRDKYAYGSALTLLQNSSANIEETSFSSNEGTCIAFMQPLDVISNTADIKKCSLKNNKQSNLPSNDNKEEAKDFIAISIVPAKFWRSAAGRRIERFFWPFSSDNHFESPKESNSIFYQLPTDNDHVQKLESSLGHIASLEIR